MISNNKNISTTTPLSTTKKKKRFISEIDTKKINKLSKTKTKESHLFERFKSIDNDLNDSTEFKSNSFSFKDAIINSQKKKKKKKIASTPHGNVNQSISHGGSVGGEKKISTSINSSSFFPSPAVSVINSPNHSPKIFDNTGEEKSSFRSRRSKRSRNISREGSPSITPFNDLKVTPLKYDINEEIKSPITPLILNEFDQQQQQQIDHHGENDLFVGTDDTKKKKCEQ